MNRSAKTKTAVLLLAVVFALTLIVGAACDKDSKKNAFGFTKTQNEKICAIAEAFFESGCELNTVTALTDEQMEDFVCYLYNSELTATDGGFGTVDAKEADARLKEYFDYAPLVHKSAEQSILKGYYYKKGAYYITVKSHALESIEMVSSEDKGDGRYFVKLKVRGANGIDSELEMTFDIEGDRVQVISCERLDEK